jgi:hypothetical protein
MLQPNSTHFIGGGPKGPARAKHYPFELPGSFQDLRLFAQGGHPYGLYKSLRENAPVYWHEEGDPTEPGFWALTRYEDIRAVSLDPMTFSSQKGGIQIAYGAPETRHPKLFAATLDTMISTDAPAHLQMRKEHMPFFMPGAIQSLRARVDAKVAALLEGIAAIASGKAERPKVTASLPQGQIDLVETLSAELPLFTLCEILGVPEPDRPKLVDWMHYLEVAQDTLTRLRFGGEITADDMAFVGVFLQKVEEMFAYGREALLARRKEPRNDLLSAIANMRVEGDLLADEYLDGSWLLIVFAGNDTSRNTISGTMKLLTENPGEKAKVLADPGLVPNMVEEAIRCVTPVIHMRRTATRDMVLNGQEIAEGEKVVMWYGAANRDPSIFEDPDRFDVTRANAKAHLAFGIGPHVCLGQRVAQMQLESCYRQLLARFPGMEYAGGIEIAPNNFVLAISKLPVTAG